MDGRASRIARAAVGLVGLGVAAVVGWILFVTLPDSLGELLGVVLAIAAAVVGGRIAHRIAADLFPDYNVAEVAVEGPITRDGGGGIAPRPGGAGADTVVEQIERADDDGNAEALIVKLNTPGGAILPSDDIKRAAEAFDGPTVAYATDVCASGGYWIASGCDELWARDVSLVGSIGVRSELVTAEGLLDRLGLSYEGFSRGEYKAAGTPLKSMTDEEREYFEGMADDFYDRFVERVSEGRGLDPDAVRGTEARLYLGEEAYEAGLVDDLGGREEVEERLAEELDREVSVRAFEPEHPIAQRIGLGARRAAYALGAGVAGAVVGDREVSFELR